MFKARYQHSNANNGAGGWSVEHKGGGKTCWIRDGKDYRCVYANIDVTNTALLNLYRDALYEAVKEQEEKIEAYWAERKRETLEIVKVGERI